MQTYWAAGALLVAFAMMIAMATSVVAEETSTADALTDSLSQEERLVEEQANRTRVFESSVAQDFVVDDTSAIIGRLSSVKSTYEDTLVDIARVYGLGYEEIRLANPGCRCLAAGRGHGSATCPRKFLASARRKRQWTRDQYRGVPDVLFPSRR